MNRYTVDHRSPCGLWRTILTTMDAGSARSRFAALAGSLRAGCAVRLTDTEEDAELARVDAPRRAA